ncbi:unnamed protein product [Rhizophagus irregularis]|nr:unnamed protein product [Rhizophagus irregularis]
METEDVDMALISFWMRQMVLVTYDDDKVPEGSTETERKKTYSLPVEEYVKWIKDLEKAGLSYIRLLRIQEHKSIAGKNQNKKSQLAQKETKKCGCKSYIHVTLPLIHQRFRAIKLEILVFALEYYNIPFLPDPEIFQNIQMLRDG